MIWIALALMTTAVVLALVWPLAGRRTVRGARAADVAFYADLLGEVEDDIARGLIAPADAAATRAEIGRRLIASGRADPAIESGSGFRGRRLAAIAMAILLVPLLSVGLYLVVGHPGQPDAPLAAREASGDMGVAIAKIEAHLVAHPEDGQGFAVLAPVYLRLGRNDDAVRAYRAVIADLGDSAERESALGQAMVAAADGVVTGDARAVFEKALALDPAFAEARFFVALAAEQDGDKPKATALWQALLAGSPADAPWRRTVEQRLATLTGAAPAAPPAPSTAAEGPASAAGAAIAALPDAQRLQAIRGMVDGLAGRLAQNGRDVEGWLRLIKAYTVLGDGERARVAVRDARVGLAGDAPALTRIEDAARDLGLGG